MERKSLTDIVTYSTPMLCTEEFEGSYAMCVVIHPCQEYTEYNSEISSYEYKICSSHWSNYRLLNVLCF